MNIYIKKTIILILSIIPSVAVYSLDFKGDIINQISKYNITLSENILNNEMYNNVEINSEEVLSVIFSIEVVKDIPQTMVGKYIQNNQVIRRKNLKDKEAFVYIDTKKMSLKNKEKFDFNQTKVKNNCLVFNDENIVLKFCNFTTIKTIKTDTQEFFNFVLYKIKK